MSNILDKLLEYAQVSAAIDTQCMVSGRWQLRHPETERRAYVHIVTSGTGVLQLPDAPPQRLYAGDLVFLPGGGEHCISDYNGSGEAAPVSFCRRGPWTLKSNTSGREDLGMLCGRFDYRLPGSLLDDLLQGYPPVVIVPWQDLPQLRAWVGLLQLEMQTAEDEAEGAYSVVNGLAQALLVWLVRYCWQQPQWQNPPPGLLRGQQDARLRPLLAAVMADPAGAWTVETMAEQVHLSRAQFMRVFQAAMAQSPHQFVMQTRLRQAAVYLRNRTDSVLQIALATGFQTESHFARLFKQHYGATPRQYRMQAASLGKTSPPAAEVWMDFAI
ncbi:AraC family transcriptional regulator [Uruburuella testudinis]|uniref:AraC family transcriptional regulator n=1 Tax=Uruburuella testudinis TaxID=1282863 RepID=A0ABY4DSI7_9NEIS|nr:AraC family transcriptional regulator [Uruburuella testudinis]UOO81836.1 AraC family transcriptional regulator [Uruburuella testudinis]